MDPVLYRIVLLVIALANSFSRHPAHQPLRPKPVQVTTRMPNAPFEWSREEKKQLLSKLKKLKRGDKMEDVVKLLGRPYRLHPISRKESEDITGTFVSYYLKKLENNGSNEKYDQEIELVFDIDNRLESTMTNIKGLTFGPLTGINSEGAELENIDELLGTKPAPH